MGQVPMFARAPGLCQAAGESWGRAPAQPAGSEGGATTLLVGMTAPVLPATSSDR